MILEITAISHGLVQQVSSMSTRRVFWCSGNGIVIADRITIISLDEKVQPKNDHGRILFLMVV